MVSSYGYGRVVRVLDPRTGQLLRGHRRQERGGYRIPEEARQDASLPLETLQEDIDT